MNQAGEARVRMTGRLKEAAGEDPRVVGLVDYGSSSEGRADEWSDVDVALFIRDADFDSFSASWVEWAGQFGRLLLAYVGGVGHPWAVYDAGPVPLRVDFAFHRESEMDVMLTWPNSPLSVESFVIHDATGGRLTSLAENSSANPCARPTPRAPSSRCAATSGTTCCGRSPNSGADRFGPRASTSTS